MAANNFRGTATSAIWKITCRECLTTLAPIFTNLSRRVVKNQCLIPDKGSLTGHFNGGDIGGGGFFA
jgi:hypothetical protein